MASQQPAYPIIDSHIHLYPHSELSQLAWLDTSAPSTLNKQYSLAEYATATGTPKNLEGFIFLETDRKHDLSTGSAGWEMPLKEVDFLRRVALGEPRDGEGHTKADAKLCLGIVPWAPVPSGEKMLEKYIGEVEKTAAGAWGKVRGFRYLVQDKPRGTMVKAPFVEGLKLLGKKGLVFDLGVNQRSGGRWQLEEAVEMVGLAHEGVMEEEKVAVIINHLCKPDLAVYNQADPSFVAWRTAMFTLAKCSKTYMKLSGCFSELPEALKIAPVMEIFMALQPYLAVILAAFGPYRIMFGSDWPVCTVGVENAWVKWKEVVEMFCRVASLSEADQIMIWSGTAIKAYGIKELL